jgi:hypothetical protein
MMERVIIGVSAPIDVDMQHIKRSLIRYPYVKHKRARGTKRLEPELRDENR